MHRGRGRAASRTPPLRAARPCARAGACSRKRSRPRAPAGSWLLDGLCPAEEKSQCGLGVRESFLDGISHYAILAACQFHPACRLQRRRRFPTRLQARRADPRPSARRAGRRAARLRRAALSGFRAAVLAAPWDSSGLSRMASSRRRTSARNSWNASSRAWRTAAAAASRARARRVSASSRSSSSTTWSACSWRIRASSCASASMRVASARVSTSSRASSAAASAFSPARRSESAIGRLRGGR